MQDKIVECLGQTSQYNPLTLKSGALYRAKDCNIRRNNIIENRRGNALFATLSNNVSQLLQFNNRVIAHNGVAISYDNGSGTFLNYSGSYSAPSGYKIRGIEAFSNLYVTTSLGVQVFTDTSGTAARKAGVPRSLGPSYAFNAAADGFLGSGFQCAYRAVIKRTDANSNVLTGYPSQRLWVYNSTGMAKNVDLTLYLPSECVAGDVIQFYRTYQESGSTSDIAEDESYLCYQYELTSTDITNGYMTFTDVIVDELLGAALYTNQSQEGMAQANDRPPHSKDLTLHKSKFMMYANTSTKQRLYVTLLGTASVGVKATGSITSGSPSVTLSAANSNIVAGWKVYGTGIPAGTTVQSIVGTAVTMTANATSTNATADLTFVTNQTITLAGQTYSFANTENVATGVVGVSISSVAANDIDSIARSLEKVINRRPSNTSVYAYYLSGPDDLPGQLLIEERGIGAAAFTVQSSSSTIGNMFFPAPPVSPATNSKSTSSNDIRKNAVYVAKDSQPEHVPSLQYYPVGPSNKEILRIVGLKDSTIVIKEEGVYRITGETAESLVVTDLDKTVFCKSPDSVAVLANQVFMLSNQGVVVVSENGVRPVSTDNDPDFTPLFTNTSLASYTYGCAYESERTYLLSTLTLPTETAPSRTWVFNAATNRWTYHSYTFGAAIVEQSVDRLFFARPSDTKLYRERKSFTDDDYFDPEYAVTITAILGSSVEFTIATVTPQPGWQIKQNGTGLTINAVATTTVAGTYLAVMSVDPPSSWATGAAIMYPNVGMEIEWHSWTFNQPDVIKQVHTVGFLADDTDGYNTASAFIATFRTNFDPEVTEVTIDAPAGGWGEAWGSTPWGGGGAVGYPAYVPMNKQMCNRLKVGVRHHVAGERMSIAGLAFAFLMGAWGVGR